MCAALVALCDRSDESAIIKVLHKKLHYLRLDDDGVRRFGTDIAPRESYPV